MNDGNNYFREKIFKSYSSKLANVLFPDVENSTFFDDEARHYVSELLCKHEENINSPGECLSYLEGFTPEIIQDAIDNPSWSTERQLNRWLNMTKPMIIQRIKNYFNLED